MDTDGTGPATASALWELFDGRRDCYGKGRGLCVKEAVTPELLSHHLAGELAIGVYPLTPDGFCRWVCVDLDLPGEPDLAQWAKALSLYQSLRGLGCCPYVERSKSKGYHVWTFFRDPVEAAWARRLAYRAIEDAGLPPDVEVFPKHDTLSPETPFGSYVNLPYFGPNGGGHRVMVNPADGETWTVNEFLEALTLTDPNDVLLGRDSKPDADDVLIAGSSGAAPRLGESAPYGQRHERGKAAIGLLVTRLWVDGEQAALDAALCWNEARCDPPLPEAEVARMVRDFRRKEERKRAKGGEDQGAPCFRFWTGAEIAAAVSPQVEWIAKPWVAAGSVTELTGKAKASGKTTFDLHMVAAVVKGVEFLGEPTLKTSVVYLTEERPGTFREHLRRAGLLDCESLHVLYWQDTKGVTWPDIVAAAVAECQRVGARLLVVDTLSQFAGLKADAENQSGAGLEAMEPLLLAAALGLAVLQVRHERKGGGEVGESGRGSTAFAAAADIVLSLKRSAADTKPNARVLHALSRFDETPDTLVIELDGAEYRALGSKTAVALSEARTAIADVLPSAEERALPMDEIMAALPEGTRRTTLQEALKELVTEGEARRCGEGKRGNPYRFWRSL